MNIIEAMELMKNEDKTILRASDRSVVLREYGCFLKSQDILADDWEVEE